MVTFKVWAALNMSLEELADAVRRAGFEVREINPAPARTLVCVQATEGPLRKGDLWIEGLCRIKELE